MTLNSAGVGAPYSFDYMNTVTSIQNPSTMHASDVGLTRFFERYLLQRAMSTFKWEMPPTWEKNYTLSCLYCWGYFAIVNTDKFGVIPQGCGLKGYNVMYAPTEAVITNPLLRGILTPKIGTQCALIKLQPDYGGVWDLVSFYAEMMSMTAATAGSNIMASKLAYLLFVGNKAAEQSYKKIFDDILSGKPASVVDKSLLNDDGKPSYQLFTNNLRANYIAHDLLEDLHEWERRFDTEIGIPHTNTDKKERLISGEVNSNITESRTRVEMWLETLQDGCEIANKLFGDIIHVDWRVSPDEMLPSSTKGEKSNGIS